MSDWRKIDTTVPTIPLCCVVLPNQPNQPTGSIRSHWPLTPLSQIGSGTEARKTEEGREGEGGTGRKGGGEGGHDRGGSGGGRCCVKVRGSDLSPAPLFLFFIVGVGGLGWDGVVSDETAKGKRMKTGRSVEF